MPEMIGQTSQLCKRCKFSALCLSQKDGWRHVFAQLLWVAGTRVGLFRVLDGCLLTPATKDKIETLTKRAETLWLQGLPAWCPHRDAVLPIQVAVDEVAKEVDIHLEFKR